MITLHRPLRLSLALCIATVFAPLATAVATEPATYQLLVLSNPAAGREGEYNDWYDRQHAPDVVSVPGFVSAQRYVIDEHQMRADATPPARYLIVFTIVTSDLPAVYAEVNQRIKDGRTVMNGSFDGRSARSYTYKAITPVTAGKGGDVPGTQAQKAHSLQLVFGAATPGKEAAFNTWYDTVHAPQVAGSTGFTHWQRFELSPVQLAPGPTQGQYLTRFDIDTANLPAVFESAVKGFQASKAPPGPGDTGQILQGYTYRAIGPLLSGDAVRAERAARAAKK